MTDELSLERAMVAPVEPIEVEARDGDAADDARPIGPARGSVRTFDYLSIGSLLAPTYRAIVSIFLDRREVFEFTLSTDEVWIALNASGLDHQVADPGYLETVLANLADRGNLHKSQSTAAAATIADLRERRSLWRLTEAGFLAETAAREVEAVFERTGALRRTALAALRSQLEGDLARFLAEDELDAEDGALLAVLFDEIFAKTEDLRASAQTFMTTLDTHLARPELTLGAFAEVRDAIFGHVDAFLAELARSGPAIGRSIAGADPIALDRLIAAAAAAEPEPTFDGSDPVARTQGKLRGKWHGLERWFCGSAGADPTFRFLQARAEESIGTLIRLLRRLNEARGRPLTKPRDFITLARWFESAIDSGEANRIWHAAFGLSPARHLGYPVDSEGEAWTQVVSWWDSPSVGIPPRLRLHGQAPSSTGHPGVMEDLTANLERLRAKVEASAAPEIAATLRFVDRGPLRLSELGQLDGTEFALLRTWLARAFRARRSGNDTILVESLDGRYLVEVHPAQEGDHLVRIETPGGRFESPDHRIEVTSAGSVADAVTA